ncbi:MAG: DNA polymerase III subunit gamma/tau [Bacillota bacterium]
MTYQVLARKWRPRLFEEVVGQAHVVTALVNALDAKRLHHAYLFTGTRGVGKTTLARILAKSINCETGITSKPCGKCRACVEIDAGRFVDLLEVDAATNTKVDEMRELLDTAQYMPVSGRFKVYIIDEVHMLSRHAFNSMLKTLEEPPEHVKFILATTDPQRLPVTVLSRCLQFNLKPLSPPVIAAHLKHVLEVEAIAFEEPALALLAKAAAGSVRDSLSLLDQAIAHGGGKVAKADVTEMLGSLGGDLLWPLLERIVAGDGPGVIAEADRIAGRSISFDSALESLASILHRVALAQAGALPADDEPDHANVVETATRLDRARVQVLYQIALLARRDLPLAPDEYSGFTMALLRMLSFAEGSQPSNAPSKPVAAAAPARQPPSAAAPNKAFDGDWTSLVQKLNLTGMAGMVARHGELASFENNRLELVVPEAQKMYAEKPYVEKLHAALLPVFGAGFRLSVKVGTTSGSSVAAINDRANEQRRESAVEAIEEDPFVRDLVRDLGAEVIASSIKPTDEGREGPSGQKG